MHRLFFPFVVTAALSSTPAYADTVPDVGEALNKWVAAVEGGSADAIVDLYHTNAIMISTFVQLPMTERKDIHDYYKKVVANPDVHVDVSEQHPRRFGEMAVNTGKYTLSYTQDGEPVEIPARFSFTYVLRHNQWVIVDHHSSKVPLPSHK